MNFLRSSITDVTYPSIDDILGPKESRYFGDGFKKVDRSINSVELNYQNRSLMANASIVYPEEWSVKKKGE